MIDYQRLGDIMVGDLLSIESKIIDGEPDSIQEPIGILNVSPATMSESTLTVDELIDLFREFPRITFTPPPPGMTYAFDVKPFAVNPLI